MAVVFVVIMSLRMRGMSKMRPLKLGSLWIVPVMYLVVTAWMSCCCPPVGWVAIASVAGLLIGAAVGWQRGKMMHIHVDPDTHALNQKASPAAMFFLIALIIVRKGGQVLVGTRPELARRCWTDPLIAFALGMFS